MKLLLMFNLVGALAAVAMVAEAPDRTTESASNSTVIASNVPNDSLAMAAGAPDESESADEQPADGTTSKAREKAERDYPIHDFSKLTGREDDSCSACHLPHVQIGEEDLSNLGAGELFKIARQRPALATGRYTPGPTSMICLTCHNGSVAVSTVGTAHAMRSASGGAWSPSFATRDHPIGVLYPDRKKGFRPKAGVEAIGKIKLPDGRVECISCHDQHEEEELPHLLVMSNKRSALCLSCHEK